MRDERHTKGIKIQIKVEEKGDMATIVATVVIMATPIISIIRWRILTNSIRNYIRSVACCFLVALMCQ